MKIFITVCFLGVVVFVQSTPIYKVQPKSDTLEKKVQTGEESKEYDLESAIPEDEEFPEFNNSHEYIDGDEHDLGVQLGYSAVDDENDQERDVTENGQENAETIYKDEIALDDTPISVSDYVVEETEDGVAENLKDVADVAALNSDEQGNDGSDEELDVSEGNDQEPEEQLNEDDDEEDTSHAQLKFVQSKMDALAPPGDTGDGSNKQQIINDAAESAEQNKVTSDAGINEERTKTSVENNVEEDLDSNEELIEDEDSEDEGNVQGNLVLSDNAEESDGKLDDSLSNEYEDDDDQ